jgi:hypothetical protein
MTVRRISADKRASVDHTAAFPHLEIDLLDLGKIWERTQDLKTPAKSHRINGPCVFVCSHNPKVVSSNRTPATIS